MSMINVTYSGYGLDLGDLSDQFSGKNAKKLSNLWGKFVSGESDTLIDYSLDCNTPLVTVIWPNCTDDFKMLLLIPDVPGVQLDDNQVSRPTKTEANDLLYQELKNLLKVAQTDLSMSDSDINEILKQIKQPFYDYIKYHYNDEWSDLI